MIVKVMYLVRVLVLRTSSTRVPSNLSPDGVKHGIKPTKLHAMLAPHLCFAFAFTFSRVDYEAGPAITFYQVSFNL